MQRNKKIDPIHARLKATEMSPRPNDDDEELRFQTKSQGSRNCESEVGDKTEANEVLKRKETV